jgi:P-type Cu2+ transporter
VEEISTERMLALAAAAQQRFTHPVAEAIVGTATAQRLSIPERDTSEYRIGRGVKATVEGSVVLVGNRRFMAINRVSVRRASQALRRVNEAATSPVFIAIDGQLVGVLVLYDFAIHVVHGSPPRDTDSP